MATANSSNSNSSAMQTVEQHNNSGVSRAASGTARGLPRQQRIQSQSSRTRHMEFRIQFQRQSAQRWAAHWRPQREIFQAQRFSQHQPEQQLRSQSSGVREQSSRCSSCYSSNSPHGWRRRRRRRRFPQNGTLNVLILNGKPLPKAPICLELMGGRLGPPPLPI